jgi:hypothetical protein
MFFNFVEKAINTWMVLARVMVKKLNVPDDPEIALLAFHTTGITCIRHFGAKPLPTLLD